MNQSGRTNFLRFYYHKFLSSKLIYIKQVAVERGDCRRGSVSDQLSVFPFVLDALFCFATVLVWGLVVLSLILLSVSKCHCRRICRLSLDFRA